MSDIVRAIETLKRVCEDDFSVSLSEKDFNRLYSELRKVQRNPPQLETGFKFPVIKVHGMTIKNLKFFKNIQKEINAMINYITEDSI